MNKLFATLLACLALLGCAHEVAPPQTVAQLDLQRYQGTWFEIARLPLFFQRHCTQSQADYQLREDGRIAVHNRCRTADGEWLEAHGVAEVQAGPAGRLQVRFDNWFSRLFPGLTTGDYWVLYLADDYSLALVGHPQRKYLWLLARTPQIEPAQREQLLQIAQAQGYTLDALIWRAAEPH